MPVSSGPSQATHGLRMHEREMQLRPFAKLGEHRNQADRDEDQATEQQLTHEHAPAVHPMHAGHARDAGNQREHQRHHRKQQQAGRTQNKQQPETMMCGWSCCAWQRQPVWPLHRQPGQGHRPDREEQYRAENQHIHQRRGQDRRQQRPDRKAAMCGQVLAVAADPVENAATETLQPGVERRVRILRKTGAKPAEGRADVAAAGHRRQVVDLRQQAAATQ